MKSYALKRKVDRQFAVSQGTNAMAMVNAACTGIVLQMPASMVAHASLAGVALSALTRLHAKTCAVGMENAAVIRDVRAWKAGLANLASAKFCALD